MNRPAAPHATHRSPSAPRIAAACIAFLLAAVTASAFPLPSEAPRPPETPAPPEGLPSPLDNVNGQPPDQGTPWYLIPYPGVGPNLRPEDLDGDGLYPQEEAEHGTSNKDEDSDNDWLGDYREIRLLHTDPTSEDSDGDRVPDYYEVTRGMDPLDPADGAGDLDGDSYDHDLDGTPEIPWNGWQEYAFRMPPGWDWQTFGPWSGGTLPTRPDTDNDGAPDAREIFHANDPRAPLLADPLTDDPQDWGGVPVDEDDDGLTLYWEWVHGTSPASPDSDGDHLCDGGGRAGCAGLWGWESALGSDPALADSDGDGLEDGIEAIYWTNAAYGLTAKLEMGYPLEAAAGKDADVDLDRRGGVIDHDSDADGLTDGSELLVHGTDPALPDSDGDGLLDGFEASLYGTLPLLADSDGDLLTDGEEALTFLTPPATPDADGDGLPDGVEVLGFGSDPHQSDSDADTVADGFEASHGMAPTVRDGQLDPDQDWVPSAAEWRLGTLPESADSNLDGVPDGWVDRFGLDAQANLAALDGDHDGLALVQEVLAGTLPNLADSDADGALDGEEVNVLGTSPLLRDTDLDGLLDGAERDLWAAHGGDWHANLRAADGDQDGLTDYEEFLLTKTDPADPATVDGTNDGVQARERQNPLFTVRFRAEGAFAPAWPDGDGMPRYCPVVGYVAGQLERPATCDEPLPAAWEYADFTCKNRVRNQGPTLGEYCMPPYPFPGNGWPITPKIHGGLDSDRDGLTDVMETLFTGTSVAQQDTDCDGLTDGYEFKYWGDRWNDPAPGQAAGTNRLRYRDVDADGLYDGVELGLFRTKADMPFFTDPGQADSDGDSFGDGWEVRDFWGVRCTPWASGDGDLGPVQDILDTLGGGGPGMAPQSMAAAACPSLDVPEEAASTLAYVPLLDPTLTDSDGDGLDDLEECQHATDPLACDSDADGLGDGLELGKPAHPGPLAFSPAEECPQFDRDLGATVTDPLNRNSDGDDRAGGGRIARLDGEEDAGHDGVVTPTVDSDPNLADSDGDGIPDTDEILAAGQDPLCTLLRDCDRDGLPDYSDGVLVGKGNLGVYAHPALVDTGYLWHYAWGGDGREPAFLDEDADDDGVLDGREVGLDRLGYLVTPWMNADGDADAQRQLPLQNLVDSDSDNDAMPDGIELKEGALAEALPGLPTNPFAASSDGDPIPDGLDILPLSGLASPLLRVDFGAVGLHDCVDAIDCLSDVVVYPERLAVWLDERDRQAGPLVSTKPNVANVRTDGQGVIEDLDFELPPAPLHLPQDVKAYGILAGGEQADITLWLSLILMEKDFFGVDDRLDIGTKATPIYGHEGKEGWWRFSLRELVANPTQPVSLDGRADGGRADCIWSDRGCEDDAVIELALLAPETGLDELPNLLAFSCEINKGYKSIAFCDGYRP